MNGEALIILALIIPLFSAGVTRAFASAPDVRDTLTIVAGVALSIVWVAIAMRTLNGDPPSFVLIEPLAGLSVAFRLEPLGALFAVMASVLWAVNSLFSVGYMRGRKEAHQTRFYMCFGIAMFATMGIAMAANFFTLFVFYEVLTLSTYPLVAHAGSDRARRGSRIYLITLVGASVALLLPGVILVQVLAGTTEFRPGGILPLDLDPMLASLVLVLLVFGTAKAALIPMHNWLPNAMVAPTPVSALLHAVAVVKAGVFTLLKTSAYIFGPGMMAATPAAEWLLWLAGGTIIVASLVAMTKDELKARLAWSTVGQLAYITAAALMATSAAIVAGGLHMVAHAFGKITLFMCAGAIYVGAGMTHVSQLRGMARRMPWVFIAFAIGALSVVGAPPLAGFWSKYLLMTSAFESAHGFVAWAMIISSLLSAIYLLQVVLTATTPATEATEKRRGKGGAPVLTVAPLILTAAGTIALFFLAGWVLQLLEPVRGGAL